MQKVVILSADISHCVVKNSHRFSKLNILQIKRIVIAQESVVNYMKLIFELFHLVQSYLKWLYNTMIWIS